MAPPEAAMRKAWDVLQDGDAPVELQSLLLLIDQGVRTLEEADSRGYSTQQVAPLALSVIKASDLYTEAKAGWEDSRSWLPSYRALKWSTGVHTSRIRARDREMRTQMAGLLSEPPPASSSRRCTDLGGCFGFLFALVLFGLVACYAVTNGNWKRLTAVPDFQGRLCGVDRDVVDKPLLFFCQEGSGVLLYDFPICVSSCPDPRHLVDINIGCPKGTAPSYKSRPFLDVLCLRTRGSVGDQSEGSWHWQTKTAQLMERVAMVPRAWFALAVPAAISAVLGLVYVVLLEHIPHTVAWVGLVTFSVVWGGIGALMIWVSQQTQTDLLPGGATPWYFLGGGITLVLVSLVAIMIAVMKRETIWKATGCIRASCEVIRDMPSIMLEPFLALAIYGVCGVYLFLGLVYLVSCVKEERQGQSMFVSLVFGPKEVIFIGYYLFMSMWIMEICSSMLMFAVSHAAQSWFFASSTQFAGKAVGDCVGIFSWWAGVRSHIGTLVMGSLVIVILRPLRTILNVINEAITMDNTIGRVLRRNCMCFVAWYKRTLLFLSRTAFIDVAIHGSGFLEAAFHTRELLTDSAYSPAELQGATWLCQIAGMGGISAIGGGITYALCRSVWAYSSIESDLFVQDPWFLSILSAVVCLHVAWPFMLVFSHVSDTILFCFATERLRYLQMGETWDSQELGDMSSGFGYFLGMHDDDEVFLRTNKVLRNHPPETQALLRSTLSSRLSHGMRSLSTAAQNVAPWNR